MMGEHVEKNTSVQRDQLDGRQSAAVPGASPASEKVLSVSDAKMLPPHPDQTASGEPQPTYVPAAMAMGIMMLLWGILTNWIMSAAGALVVVWAVAGWVKEMHQQ